MATATRTRRARGSLSRAEIVDAALGILDAEGDAGLTFSRLGAELGASSTAVYRYFASRQDLLRAIADHLDGLSLAGYEPSDDWRRDLRELADRAWAIAKRHHAAAALSMHFITGGMNELRAVDSILRALHLAGLSGSDAVAQYQVYANLVLGSAGTEAARLSGSDGGDSQEGWIQVYPASDPVRFPYADALRNELRYIDHSAVFGLQVDMYLRSIEVLSAAATRSAG